MQRVFLREARELKGWTLEEAAEEIGVGKNTIWRWEQGLSTPHAYHTERICRAYGLPAEQLGLPERRARKGPPARVAQRLQPVDAEQQEVEAARTRLARLIVADLPVRLSYLLHDWLLHARFTGSLCDLQGQVSREVESYDTMTKQDHPNHGGIDEGRRRALRTLALIPLQALGLGIVASRAKLAWTPQEFLMHCAAGITACQHLAKGQHEDIALASDAITGYLPTLQTLVKESSTHRKEAANLAAQCWHLKTVISLHQGERPQHAADYGQRALTYAEESEELPLQFDILRRFIWLSICSRQPAQAFKASLKIQSLIEHPAKPVPPLVQSMAYASIARGQAYNNRQQEAFAILPQMYDAYTQIKDDENFIYVEYSGPVWYEGLIHYHLGQYDEAFETFSKIVDPQTLMLKLPMASERSRIETINHMTLAALKRPNKDKELIVPLWMAGIQGARNLQSEQRYEEAMTAYGIMEALWSDDAQIRDLRDLMGHW